VTLLAVVLLSDHLTGIVGAAWHREKINATPQLTAVTQVAEQIGAKVVKDYLASKGVKL
jgi:hypothetical protein